MLLWMNELMKFLKSLHGCRSYGVVISVKKLALYNTPVARDTLTFRFYLCFGSHLATVRLDFPGSTIKIISNLGIQI